MAGGSFVSNPLPRFRDRQKLNEPRFLGCCIHPRWIQAHSRQFIDGGSGISGILMSSCQHALPSGIKKLAGDTLARTDGGMERFKNAIHITPFALQPNIHIFGLQKVV